MDELFQLMKSIGGLTDNENTVRDSRGQRLDWNFLDVAAVLFRMGQLDLIKATPGHQTVGQLPGQPFPLGVGHAVNEGAREPTSGLNLTDQRRLVGAAVLGKKNLRFRSEIRREGVSRVASHREIEGRP